MGHPSDGISETRDKNVAYNRIANFRVSGIDFLPEFVTGVL